MGDPGKLLLLEATLKVISNQNLLENVRKTGSKLKTELHKLENEFSEIINSTRGRGTFLAFNGKNTEIRNTLLKKLKENGKTTLFC